MQTLILMVHGGSSTGERKDDNIKIRNVVKNTYGQDLGTPLWGERLDKYLNKQKFQVLAPLFPNATDMLTSEIERFLKQILTSPEQQGYKNLILIGHSMGTLILQNFLAKHNLKDEFEFNLKQLHLVGCADYEGDYKIIKDWGNIHNQISGESVFIYHSKDDNSCPFADAEMYHANLPGSRFEIFEDRGHFDQPAIPELIANIQGLKI